MGKLPYLYTDSEEDTSSSVENIKKKKKLSILKYTGGNLRKKKCKVHSRSDQEDSDERSRSRSSHRIGQKLRGILKHTNHDPVVSDEDDESEPSRILRSKDRCLVGRVPRPPGCKPGRGGGVAIVVRKNISSLQPQQSTSSTKRKRTKRLLRKQSY